MEKLKGKEKLIGVILAIVIAVAAAMFGLDMSQVKEGMDSVSPAKTAAPAVSPVPTK